MKSKATRIITIIWVALSFAVLFTPTAYASGEGNNPDNYTCPALPTYSDGTLDPKTFLCTYHSTAGKADLITNASLKPPTLRVLEYWFIRIIYGAWAISGIVFTLILGWLGFTYMTSQGNSTVIADVQKRAKNWFIGLALIFLSYPVLTTIFNVIGLSETQCFSNLNLPAFQFFFPTACTANSTK